MQKINVNVLRTAGMGDCTNGGVTSRHDRMILFWDCEREEALDYANENGMDVDACLWLEPRVLWGHEHPLARPLIHQSGKCGPMMGGNFVYTSDSRMPLIEGWLHAPIPVHDRYETQQEYDALSV